MPGAPDYQTYALWRSSNLLAASVQTFPVGSTASAVQNMSNWKGAQLRVISQAGNTGYGRVTLRWWSDSAKTTLLGSDDWGVNSSTGLDVIMPIKGPYCDVNVNNTSAVNFTASTQLVGTNTAGEQPSYPVLNNVFNTGNVSVPISGTVDFVLPWIKSGDLGYNFQPADTTGKLTCILAEYHESGAFNFQLANLGGLTANATGLYKAPDDICGVHIINTDGTAAHTIAVRLITGAAFG